MKESPSRLACMPRIHCSVYSASILFLAIVGCKLVRFWSKVDRNKLTTLHMSLKKKSEDATFNKSQRLVTPNNSARCSCAFLETFSSNAPNLAFLNIPKRFKNHVVYYISDIASKRTPWMTNSRIFRSSLLSSTKSIFLLKSSFSLNGKLANWETKFA